MLCGLTDADSLDKSVDVRVVSILSFGPLVEDILGIRLGASEYCASCRNENEFREFNRCEGPRIGSGTFFDSRGGVVVSRKLEDL